MEFDDHIKSELVRLCHGKSDSAQPDGIVVSYEVQCADNAESVANKAKRVLTVIDEYSLRTSWPDRMVWVAALPDWFVAACKPELSDEESRQHLQWWDSLDEAKKQEYGKQHRPWSLENWLFWFAPEQRSWFLWEMNVNSDKELLLSIVVQDLPFASGALEWLLRAAGGMTMDEV